LHEAADTNRARMTLFSGQDSHPPPLSPQIVGEMKSDQQRLNLARQECHRRRAGAKCHSPPSRIFIEARQGLLWAEYPRNGAEPAVIAVEAASLKLVRKRSSRSRCRIPA